MKLRWKIAIGFALVLAVIAIIVQRGNQRARRAVELYRQELRARGEKLTLEELIPPTPAGPNGAAAFLSGAARLKGASSNSPPIMKLLGPGHALVTSRLHGLPTEETPDVWPFLLGDVDTDAAALAEVRDALTNQVLVFQITYQQGLRALLPHLVRVKQAMRHLSDATIVTLHRGDATQAWENLRATGRLVRIYCGEPSEISQLVRVATMHYGVRVAWEALQQDCWLETQLAELQSDWESVELLGALEAAFAMESAMASQYLDQARVSHANLELFPSAPGTPTPTGFSEFTFYVKELFDDPSGGFKELMKRYPDYWKWKTRRSYEYELANMKMLRGGVESARQARKQRSFAGVREKYGAWVKLDPLLMVVEAFADRGELPHVETNSVSRLFHEVGDIEIQRHLLITAIALKRFHLRHGAYPAELRELIPDFLSTLPIDWMDGKPLRYRRNEDDTFLLYSGGEDGVDNGGDPTPTEPGAFQPGNTKSVSWWKARDAVWPSPATAAEVKAYEEALKQQRAKSRK